MKILALFLPLLGLFTIAAPVEPPLRITSGPLQVEVHISRTSNLFHVVDQLSAWDRHYHAQYLRRMGPLSAEDRKMAARHAALRAKRGWGGGLEQTFYSPLGLDESIAEGVQQGRITAAEGAEEREILTYFAPRVDALLAAQRPVLVALQNRLKETLPKLATQMATIARFAGGPPPLVPFYLIANPDPSNYGGGFNGDRLTLEIPAERDCLEIAMHELFHAFLRVKSEAMTTACKDELGLNREILNEGLTHAFSPGLFRVSDSEGDPLLERVKHEIATFQPITPHLRLALAVRPLLKAALADERQTFETLLPKVLDAWRALVAQDLGSAPTRKPAAN
jgi:hypothetical protein